MHLVRQLRSRLENSFDVAANLGAKLSATFWEPVMPQLRATIASLRD